MNYPQWPDATSARDPFAEPPYDWAAHRSPLNARTTDIFPTQEEMLRICLDFAPAAGNDALGRLLGPWSDELDVRRPSERAVLKWAIAAACFIAPDDHGKSPFVQWASRQPLPSVALRESFRAIALSPWGLWEEIGGLWRSCTDQGVCGILTRDEITPLEPARLFGSADRTFWLARLVQGSDLRWRAVLPMAIGARPPSDRLDRWINGLTPDGLAPRAEDRSTLLAARGHVFVRRVLEWCWRSRLDVETLPDRL